MRQPWTQAQVGQDIGTLEFFLPVSRLVMAAGSNRDFNSIHHNSEYARSTGAPEMYANNYFLQGMWERLIRDYVGMSAHIHSFSGFRIRSFNVAGDTVKVTGKVVRKWEDGGRAWLDIEVASYNRTGLSIGPGNVMVSFD